MSKVTIVPYDPSWPQTFERLREAIWPAIGDVATAIEHVGSTSVPGLVAKPVIDMTIVVPSGSAMGEVVNRLEGIGYRHRGDLGVPGREAFGRPPGSPAHHLYACVEGNDALLNHLALRDHLRGDPASARAYGSLKSNLAERFPEDIDSYIDGKTEFILGIIARVGFSADRLDTIRAVNKKPDAAG